MGAIADVTDLWQAAATLMGETGTQRILDATNPTTPLELTFDSFYDRVRLSMLRATRPHFARRYETLRLAPNADAYGTALTWSQTWSYVYRKPAASIKFLGFQRDRADRGLVTSFEIAKLPIYYLQMTTDAETSDGIYTFPEQTEHLYRGYCYSEPIYDSVKYKYTIVEDAASLSESLLLPLIAVDDFGTEWELGDTSWWWFNSRGSTPALGALDLNGPSFIWGPATDPPDEVTLNVAAQPNTSAQWSDNILCDVSDASGFQGVYLVDETDPSVWTEEFQDLVALDLARKAAPVHAKSSKTVQNLNDERALAFSLAVVHDEESVLDGSSMASSSERARA